MKQYKYVTLYTATFGGMSCKEHRQIIENYASQGYKYVGYIPTKMNSHGVITEIDLIFEKE